MALRVDLLRVILSFALAGTAAAQLRTSSISGEVADPAGKPVAGAAVILENPATGQRRNAATSDQGFYLFDHLELGRYRVEVRAAGFAPSVRDDIELLLDRKQSLRHAMALATQNEALVVVASAVLVDSSAASLSQLVEQIQIRELPLNGRDYIQLAATQPGVHVAAAQSRDGNTGFGVQLSIGGSRPMQNNFRLDGISVTNQTGSTPGSILGLNLGVDALREVSLVSGAYSAVYGRSAGGVVNAVTRSGSNEFHGSGVYFHRNSALDARNYFDGEAPPFRRHHFSGDLAGPVRRNRTFFFVNAEGILESQGFTKIDTTVSDNARQGRLTAGSVPVDASIARLLALYPRPNSTILGDTGLFVFPDDTTADEAFLTARLDHTIGARDNLFGRYTIDRGSRNSLTNFALTSRRDSTRVESLAAEETHIFSAQTLNSIRFGWVRSQMKVGETIGEGSLADTPSLAFVPSAPGPGVVLATGLSDFQGGTGAVDSDTSDFQSIQVYDDVSHSAGRHLIRAGGSIEATSFFLDSTVVPIGEYNFRGIADLLQNRPLSFRAPLPSTDTRREFRQGIFAWYLHDTIRVSRRLNVDLSVRHEWITVPTEKDGKISTLTSLTDTAPVVGGALFRNPSRLNFAPRVGAAWNLSGSGGTVLRAGYGLYHDQLLSQFLLISGVRNPPFFLQPETRNLTQGALPSGGWTELVANPTIALRFERLDPFPSQPYVQHWSASLQQQVTAEFQLQASYAGSHGLNLSTIVEDANLVQPVRLPDGRLFFPAGGTKLNSVFGQIRNRPFNGHSFYHALQLSGKRRWSRGWLVQAAYTMAHSIDDDSSTFARTDAANSIGIPVDGVGSFNRGSSSFDVRHHFSVHAIGDLPSPSRGFARAVFGGWKAGALVFARTGLPFSATLGYDAARTGTTRPDYRGGQRPDANPAFSGNPITGNPNRWVDPTAFLRPAAGFLGNLGRSTLTGPGLVNADVVLSRDFRPAGERWLVGLRFEVFNVMNHTNFDLPIARRTQVFSASSVTEDFARITSAGPSRKIQIGMRFSF